jgi:two-component system alkaline phosphatase synthesis response regulator PhoP
MSDIKILIVDDEEDIVEFLEYNLKKEGYEVSTAFDGHQALDIIEKVNPHLILLDIMMPEMNGIDVCEALRKKEKFKNTLVCFLTARNESFTQISALDSGGDDFITKPIKPNVLVSRIKALLRRHVDFQKNNVKENSFTYDKLTINFEKFNVSIEGQEINLAKKEFELLALLVSKPGKVFKREEIMQKIWGDDIIVGERTLDVHIRKLREKIGEKYIATLKGVGYKFDF